MPLKIGIGIGVVEGGVIGGGGAVLPPTLVSLNISTGSTAGGTVIIATGTNLTGASAVSVGGSPATAVSALDATHVQFTTPAGSAGAASITVTTPGGTSSPLVGAFTYVVVMAPVLDSIASEIGVAAGGTKQTLRGYNFSSGSISVTFNGVAATSIVIVNDNKLTCLTPAGTASETGVDVVVSNSAGSSTLSAAFEYGAVTTTTQGSQDFSASTYTPFTNDTSGGGTNTIISVPFARGTTTKCVQSSSNGTTSACVDIAIANNTPLNAAHGQFVQYDMAVPSATLALIIANGQIKNSLVRPTSGGSSPSNLMLVAGIQATGAGSQLLFAIDNGIVGVLGSVNGCLLGDNNWQGITMQVTRTAGVSGRVRVWRRGLSGSKLVAVITSANIGGDTTTTSYTPSAGLVFTQAASAGTLNVYTANVQMSDGWLEALNS